MENLEGQKLNEWEFNFIQNIDPTVLRKRLRDEFEYLYSVGTILNVFKNDDLLAHILAYAWKHTYHIALVCKRFYAITKTKRYWTALAKHALSPQIPQRILPLVNFFFFCKPEDPVYLCLQGILTKKYRPQSCENAVRLFYPIDGIRLGRLIISWEITGECYMLEHGNIMNATPRSFIYGETHTIVSFGHHDIQKVVWVNVHLPSRSFPVSRYQYCEVYCPKRNQTWYGQPGILESPTDVLLDYEELYPSVYSFGVWV